MSNLEVKFYMSVDLVNFRHVLVSGFTNCFQKIGNRIMKINDFFLSNEGL